ncbi:MAG: T9SS type A sorting domain-containing protein [Ignavibacteriales bacterium]|nr:T9SS type A sorting domain-containing protein [Ignavibacteriales bacterium]
MKKGILTTLVLFSLLSIASFAQQWVNQGAWPDATVRGQLHGVTVDPDGKVWAGNFGTEKILPVGSSDSIVVNQIRVYNADGSPASFSPIWKVVGNGINDTLKATNVRGLRTDNNGNILLVLGNKKMYRFNYQTGAGMNKVDLAVANGGTYTSPTAPAVSNDGKIFVGPVVNAGYPIMEFDTDFNKVGEVTPAFTISGFSRTLECSADGNTVYFPIYDRKFTMIYQRPDELSSFDSVGVLFTGTSCESMGFQDAAKTKLWFSAGSFFAAPNGVPDSPWVANNWYKYDVTSGNVDMVNTIQWSFNVPNSENERPRGIAFSPDGNSAYVGVFGQASDLVQKITNDGSGVDENGQSVVDGYKLSQNYPNPFNPTTKINFELRESGFATLKVYDMLGNEVATLIQNELTSGAHSVNFSASNIASGTYFYQLNVNGTRITNKMVVLK